jgi:hypothetical protein
MSDLETRPDDAGERVAWAAQFVGEDIGNRELRYHLLRLTAIGLRREEIEPLLVLARRAFAEADVAEQAAAITEDAGSSPLAVAIAGIVGAVGRGPGGVSRAGAMTGAIVGAYTGLGDEGIDRTLAAVLGAVGGALVRAYGQRLDETIAAVGPEAYLQSLPDGGD